MLSINPRGRLLHPRARKQTLTNGSVTAMPSFGAVCHIAATEAVAFDYAFKPPAFRDSDRIDKISFNKKGRADYVARFHFLGKIAEFFDAFDGKGTEFFDMTEQRFGYPALLLIFKTKLNSFVPVAFHGFALDHAVGAREHNRDRDQHALFVVDARLAKFFSKESEHRIKF